MFSCFLITIVLVFTNGYYLRMKHRDGERDIWKIREGGEKISREMGRIGKGR